MDTVVLQIAAFWFVCTAWIGSAYALRMVRWRHIRFHEHTGLRLSGAGVFFLLGIWFFFQLVQSAIVQEVRPFELTASDISDWRQFARKLTAGESPDTPAGRFFELLEPSAKAAAQQLAANTGTENLDAPRKVLQEDLQRVLKVDDLYIPGVFDSTSFRFGQELQELKSQLNERQIEQLNRLLLEASFPELVSNSWRSLFLPIAVVNSLTVAVMLYVAVGLFGRPWRQLGLHLAGIWQRLAYGLCQAAFWGPLALASIVAARSLFPPDSVHLAQTFFAIDQSGFDWMLLVLTVVVLAPVMEELIFRGLLQAWLSRLLPARVAILATALLFGFAHFSTWPDPIALTLLGVGMGITFQTSRSLWSCIAFHAAFNAFGVFTAWAGT